MSTKSVLRRVRKVAAAAVATTMALLVAGAGSVPATATTAPYVPWSTYLPGWTDEYIPTSENDCVAGRANCLKATRRELGRILQATAESCSHNAIFALAYTRITQAYAWSREIPGYYADLPYMNHMDAVFAKYYTDAYHAYQAGNRAAVPQAWLTAFDAARDRRVSGVGDLLLGMNAHINRDLPFVLAATGLVTPDGVSGKGDYDKVEEFLNEASVAMMAEAAARFDPGLDDAADPLGAAYFAIFQFISAARENAWRNAEALVTAPNAAARALVAANIEAQASTAAQGIVLAQAYLPPLSSTTARDAYCSAHRSDTAPVPYPFGTPGPYDY